MKKTLPLLLVMLFLLSLCAGCGRNSIDAYEFTDKAEAAGYSVFDNAEIVNGNGRIVEYKIAAKDEYKIEFAEVSTLSYAKVLYSGNKSKVQQLDQPYTVDSSNDTRNYSKYVQTSNDKYSVVSQVDKTVIYVRVDLKYKDEVDAFIKSIGY